MASSSKKTKPAAPTASATAFQDKVRFSIYLAPESAQRLKMLAVKENKRYSAVAEELVLEGLARRGA